MEKVITVDELVKNYSKKNSSEAKENYLKNTIRCEKYISYWKKYEIAIRIVKSTSYKTEVIKNKNDKGEMVPEIIFGDIKVDSPMRYAYSIIFMIDMYTNIKVDMDHWSKEFDLLNQYDLIRALFSPISSFAIPERESEEFNTIVRMVYDDIITNEYESHAFIANQVGKFADVVVNKIEPLMPLLTKYVNLVEGMNDQQKADIVNKVIPMMFKK